MSEYFPDRWAIVELKTPTETHYKILASWYGGYTGSDSWKLSSGITSIVSNDKSYEFHNHSGSIYKCNKRLYGMSGYTSGIYSNFEKQNCDEFKIRLLDEDEVENLSMTHSSGEGEQ